MKRLVIFAAILMLSVAGIAVAQPPGPPDDGGPGFGPGFAQRGARSPAFAQRGPRGLARAAEYLELTDEQVEQMKAIHEAQREALQPLFEQMRENRTALHDAIEAEDADAIGDLTLAGKALREQIGAQHESLKTELEAILTPEQLEKWEAFQAAAKAQRGPRGRRGHGPGHGPGPGQG